jgi:hypothetical protein
VASYVVKLGLAMAGILLLGVLGIFIFADLWARVGIGAAMVVFGGGLILLAWWYDRRDKERRGGVDELPPV